MFNFLKNYNVKYQLVEAYNGSAKELHFSEYNESEIIPELKDNKNITQHISITNANISVIKDLKMHCTWSFYGCNILELKNINQNSNNLGLYKNKIFSLDNHRHNGHIDLRENPINDLTNFKFNKYFNIYLTKHRRVTVLNYQKDLISYLNTISIKTNILQEKYKNF